MKLWNGAGVALVTPFKNDQVDYDALGKLISWQIEEGTDALIMAGTTGESATLSKEEKLEIFRYTLETAGGRVPVIAGTGSNNTLESIALSKEAEALGVDGLLLVTPYYNKPSQRGLYAHYKAISDEVGIPIILYNVPGRTSVDLLPETVIELSKLSNVMALKEASGHPERAKVILEKVKADFKVYSGNDNEIFDFLENGGHGVISVLSNVAPKVVHDLVSEYHAGNVVASSVLQLEHNELIDALFMETNPVPAKEALNLMGYNAGDFRLPLVGLADENKVKLIEVLKKYSLIEGGGAR